jgi:C4-dicarboxylate-binding protein DctP
MTRANLPPKKRRRPMTFGLSRRDFGRAAVAGLSSFAILRHARGEEALKIRCSLDTAPSHVRNISVVDYLKKLEDASGGKITS